MRGKSLGRLLSAILTSTICFGIMVVIVEEGPIEMPYYDGTLKNPLTSPQLESIDTVEPQYVSEETNGEYAEEDSNSNGAYQNAAYENGNSADEKGNVPQQNGAYENGNGSHENGNITHKVMKQYSPRAE